MICEPEEEYRGDIIRIDKLIELLPIEHWEWDETGKIDLDDISIAIHEGVSEVSDPYGDTWNHPVIENVQEIGILEEFCILSNIQTILGI